jgi:circadian clock protein KaiC
MTNELEVRRIATGIRNLDDILCGGLPRGSTIVLAGPPGSGKTVLAQQVGFHNASPERKVLVFGTLSEPTAKTLRFLKSFAFFDAKKYAEGVQFVDLGEMAKAKGLEQAFDLLMGHVEKLKPAIVIIDSFKVFDDLAKTPEELRKFGYEVAVNLMAWECTALLLGEYAPRDFETNPIFSVVDGLVQIEQREVAGEQQRFFRVVKMRGTDHSRDEHSFGITDEGIELYTPRVTIRRERHAPDVATLPRARTGIAGLDALLGEGIPAGASVLVAGSAGLGKTMLSLEALYRAAKDHGERGVFFSFEEPEGRLLEGARLLGWDLAPLVASGLIEIVSVPQPEVMPERQLLMMRARIERSGATRIAIDSLTTLLYKVRDSQVAREKVFQLASLVYNRGAVGFFTTTVPYGTTQISRFGVEETVLDGVIRLDRATRDGVEERTLEVLKLRNTAHAKGRHPFSIGPGGLRIGAQAP